MKQIFTFLFVCMCALGLNAQSNVMVCNFDDVYPDVSSWGDVSFDITNAPAGTLASGVMGVLTINADNENGSMIIQLDFTFDPRDYVGVSFVAQVTEAGLSPAFISKLDQSSDPGNLNQIQDWTYNVRYSGSGDWEEINLPFEDAIIPSLGDKLANDPSFPADQYDKIELAPGAWDNQPTFTMNIDNIMLRTSWEDTGIPLMKTDATILTVVNGIISAKATNGSPVSLKVYSVTGQEIADGIGQVSVGFKGVYVVKTTVGGVAKTTKIVVQ